MSFGYCGKILRLDLANESWEVEEPDDLFYRTYMGGRNFLGYYLLREVPRGADPLGPENVIVFATGVTTGVPFPGNSRFTVGAKSPQNGGWGESEAGGHWGPELKRSGYDAIIIRGTAREPRYLVVSDQGIELRSAAHLWGLDTGDTESAIKRELRDESVQVATIGPAGENLVAYACIVHNGRYVCGRTGLGAVMGAKKLKAIAVRGRRPIEVADKARVREISGWFADNFEKEATCYMFHHYGTPGAVSTYEPQGALPSLNYREGSLPGAQALSGESMREEGIIDDQTGCFACPVRCKMSTADPPARGMPDVDPRYGVSQYETIAALGSNVGIANPRAVVKNGELCNRYGMDSISAGSAIAWAMECAERGLLPSQLEDGTPLRFGSIHGVHKLLKLIALRQGELGGLLADGAKAASNKVGEGSEGFAVHSKGVDLAMQDPRGYKVAAALGYAVAPTGGDHIQMEHDYLFQSFDSLFFRSIQPLGVLKPLPAMDLSIEKVKMFIAVQTIWSLYNVLDICIFVGVPGHTFLLQHLVDLVNASTGWNAGVHELLKAGERGLNLARIFNLREGLTARDDRVPERLFEPIIVNGEPREVVDEGKLLQAVRQYYGLMGWDLDDGVPTESTLHRLDISWAKNL